MTITLCSGRTVRPPSQQKTSDARRQLAPQPSNEQQFPVPSFAEPTKCRQVVAEGGMYHVSEDGCLIDGWIVPQ